MVEDITASLSASFNAVPAWNWALQGVGLLTAYVGAELNTRMKISGFYVWLVSNVTLAALHAATSLWLLLVLDLLFFRVNLMGIRRWRAQHPEGGIATHGRAELAVAQRGRVAPEILLIVVVLAFAVLVSAVVEQRREAPVAAAGVTTTAPQQPTE
jgi:nicotinamide riboside transporter PnuC